MVLGTFSGRFDVQSGLCEGQFRYECAGCSSDFLLLLTSNAQILLLNGNEMVKHLSQASCAVYHSQFLVYVDWFVSI